MFAISACVTSSTPSTATNRDMRTKEAREAQDLVERSRMTLDSSLADPTIEESVRLPLRRARAVVIFPQVLKGAFLVGAASGNGAVLARDGQNGWSGPAFSPLGEVSCRFQAGGEASEILLVALTDRGVAAFQSTSAKLGADVGIAAGPVGVGAAAATENLSADVVSYVRNKGLYAGVSLSGALLAVRQALKQTNDGRPVSPARFDTPHRKLFGDLAGDRPAAFRGH